VSVKTRATTVDDLYKEGVWRASKKRRGIFAPLVALPSLKFSIGWILGVISGLLLQWASSTRDLQAMAQLLSLAVRYNIAGLKLQAAVVSKIDQSGYFRDETGSLTDVKAGQGRRVGQTFLRTTLFEATLSQQGKLAASLLPPLHDFYWNVRQVNEFRVASEDTARSEANRVFWLRQAGEVATRTVGEADKQRLLQKLKEEADCGGCMPGMAVELSSN